MWTPPWLEPWWRAWLRPARISSGSARSIRWARDSTAQKPTGRRPRLSAAAYSHVVRPSLQDSVFYTQAWSTTGLLCPITLWSAAAYHCVFCHWSSTHSSQYVLLRLKSQHRRFSFSGREWQAFALTSRSNQTSSSSLSQACSCGRQTPLSQQLLSGLSAPDVAKHAISVPGEKKVVSSLTRNSNVSL